MMAILLEFGVEVNAPQADDEPEGAILYAAQEGARKAVEWLLDHGAKVNFEVDGETRCWVLSRAVRGGHLEIVKLLVEHGADINATWGDSNALSFAIMYKQKAVEAYLRSKGALEPWQVKGQPPPARGSQSVLEHIEAHLGKPDLLSLQEIVPGDPPISIHVVRTAGSLALVTVGMSDKPMTVPEGGEEYQFAELVIYLPPNWPLDTESLRRPNNSWPVDWLRRIGRYPHDNSTWLGGKVVIFANDEPPKPLAPNTAMTCLMALTEDSDFGNLRLPDGRTVVFYSIYPLYTEERDLERQKGTTELVELFVKYRVSTVVDVRRTNVARASGYRGQGLERRR